MPWQAIRRLSSSTTSLAADPEAHYIEVLLPQKAAMYAHYVGTRSFWGDLVVLARTVAALGRG